MRIAVDAMGGDNAPAIAIDGAVEAARESGCRVVLVGPRSVVEAQLGRHDTAGLNLDIVHASQVVEMDESPSAAFRKKKDSSIMVGMKLLKNGKADAFVSAGNTGAVMAAGTLLLRTIPGVSRAALAVILPTAKGYSVLLDGGANVDCKPRTLFEFGIMGSAYAAHMLGKENPVVSILSIGEEETKGNEISREAAFLLQKSSINFTGNIEAKAVYRGTADVIVCDGFVGNISLKVSESAAELITNALKDVFSHNLRSKLGYLLVRPYLDEFKKRVDYQEHGGVPLLGLNGTVIVCHGSSRKKSIKISIVEAERFIRMDVNSRIRRMLEKNNAKENDAGKKEGYWERAEETVRHKPNQPESPR